ncbi:retron Ec67 family RNA-directed DNA polymerase/endonuclease [Bacillus sp. SIMBA_033]|uniref:retron Ec67 family RNA-directed DNA polymerase/endonuclease n=1 Tax=Bacillus sp. SIMBA_033 TaxID=3085776 RepID=UPI00397C0266
MNTFEDITSIDKLSNILRTPKKKLTYILYIKKIQNSYTTFQISKKSGGQRIINAPSKDLKDIQRNIVNMLLNQQKKFYYENKIRLNIAHAFTKEKSIITNAKIHKNKRFVLNIDLENFFESFHFGRVQGYFEKNKNYLFPKNIATVLAQLTCYNGSLPQGAPSSPIITNLICNILDMKILKIAKKYKLDYTRYADDLTFSTNNKGFDEKSEEFISQLEMIIKQSGFKINRKKTRLQYKQSRQVVTGLVVNKKVNMPRNFYKNTRAMANSLYKNGSFTINGVEGSLKQLEGRFSFINHINKENNKEKKKIDKNSKLGFRNLNGQEKEYQKFLFYKYFFNNEKPCILTEGPTDIIYLKSALKNLYTDYPKLIKKVNDDFIFKISFLKRGEDLNLKNEKIDELCDKNYLKITSNLYIVTNPLDNDLKECEIEDLFELDTLKTELNGKTFERCEKKYNPSENYGKRAFSKYVWKNYEDINFENFRPLLDNINQIVTNYND